MQESSKVFIVFYGTALQTLMTHANLLCLKNKVWLWFSDLEIQVSSVKRFISIFCYVMYGCTVQNFVILNWLVINKLFECYMNSQKRVILPFANFI